MTSRNTGWTSGACEQMAALIGTRGRNEQDAALAQQIVEHLAACAVCSSSEAGLVGLLAQYRTHPLRPPPELEQRLLNQVWRGFASDP